MGRIRSGKRAAPAGSKGRYSSRALPAEMVRGMEERTIITIINYHQHDHQQK
jgi:hypothetical protein